MMESMQLDIFMAVDELHALSARDMSKLIKDMHNFSFRFSTRKGSSMRVDVQRLATSLPLHLLACLVSTGSEPRFHYLLRGVRLLHSLSDLALRYPKLEQLFLHEVKLREQVLDLVIYMLIVLASVEQEGRVGSFIALLHAALVACCLYLLTAFVTREWHDVVPVLLAHPKVDVFMDAAFDVVKRDILLLQSKLRTLHIKLASKKATLPAAERVGEATAQQCEASLQVLQSLCQTQAFRERLLQHKELCRRGGVLRLTLAVLKLQLPSSFQQSRSLGAFISRLKSKVLVMLLKFCETESVSFLDEVAADVQSMQLAELVSVEVLTLVRSALLEDPRPIDATETEHKPMGSLHINSLRLVDLLSDDSNFRNFIMDGIAPDLGTVLATAPGRFMSRWCEGDIAVNLARGEMDATLVYDPFQAAGAVMLASGKGATALPASTTESPQSFEELNSGCVLSIEDMLPDHYAQERSALLVKLFANLYCFNPEVCSVGEKDRFLHIFVDCLASGPLHTSSMSHFLTPEQTSVRICENLSVLLDHIVSSPASVTDEDLILMRQFSVALHREICPCSVKASDVLLKEAPVVGFVRLAHEKKLQMTYDRRQQIPRWRKIYEGSAELQELEVSNEFTPPTAIFENPSPHQEKSEVDTLQSVEGQLEAKSPDLIQIEEETGINPSQDAQNGEVASPKAVEECESTEKVYDEGDDIGTVQFNEAQGKDIDLMVEYNDEETGKNDAPNNRTPKRRRDAKKPSESDEQPKKRKRNIMNEKQILTIEAALISEPEMQRNPKMIQLWTEHLNKIGPEIAMYQLKNWLNNRKARLARVARDGRSVDGDLHGEQSHPSRSGLWLAADQTVDVATSTPTTPEDTKSDDGSQLESIHKRIIKTVKSVDRKEYQAGDQGLISESTALVSKDAGDRKDTPCRTGFSSDTIEDAESVHDSAKVVWQKVQFPFVHEGPAKQG